MMTAQRHKGKVLPLCSQDYFSLVHLPWSSSIALTPFFSDMPYFCDWQMTGIAVGVFPDTVYINTRA